MCLQMIGSSGHLSSDKDQRLAMHDVDDCESCWFDYGGGVMVALAEWLSSVSDLSALEFCVFQLFLGFGYVLISQISPYSFELGLLSWILVGV